MSSRFKGSFAWRQADGVYCPICWSDWKSPVVLGCGHSFCRLCIFPTTRDQQSFPKIQCFIVFFNNCLQFHGDDFDFLSYYLTDTSRKNGCLRVIPGTHRKRHQLHDILPDAHSPEIQAIEDLAHPVFADYPEATDVPLKAGDLIIADARLIHAAWPNQTDQRRTLLLAWHDVFSFPNPPSWWTGDIPDVIKETHAKYDRSESLRTPTDYIK